MEDRLQEAVKTVLSVLFIYFFGAFFIAKFTKRNFWNLG